MSSAPTNRTFASVLRSPALAVAAAYGLRMVLLWLSHRHEDPLQPRFNAVGLESDLVAQSLATGKGFFGPYPGYAAVTAVLAPVYPFLSAIGYKLFNLSSFGALIFCQTMNAAFSAATCWPIYAIGKRVFGARIGLGSAWAWAFLPYAVLLPLEWTWDQSLSALLLACIVCATLRLLEDTSSLHWSIYGVLWGFAALVNPTLCVLLPFLLGWLAIRRWRLALPLAAPMVRTIFLFVLVLLPWTIRNYYAVDGLVFVKTNFGMELWLGNNPAVKEVYSPELHPASDFRERIALIMNGEPNYNRAKERQAIAYIRAQPGRFWKNTFDRFEDNWMATYDSRVEPWILTLGLSRADIWFCSLFSAAAFAGLILAWSAGVPGSALLTLCLVVFPMPYYITHTSLRYRHPIDPFMTILAVYALTRLYAAVREKPANPLPS